MVALFHVCPVTYILHHGEFFLFSVGDDFEDVEEDDNMDEMEQPDEDAQIDLLQQGEGGAGQLQTKRITTPYMTKYLLDNETTCLKQSQTQLHL